MLTLGSISRYDTTTQAFRWGRRSYKTVVQIGIEFRALPGVRDVGKHSVNP